MILMRGRVQGGDLKSPGCAQIHVHLRFIMATSARVAYARFFVRTFVSLNHTYDHIRNDLRSNERWFLRDTFINEAPAGLKHLYAYTVS